MDLLSLRMKIDEEHNLQRHKMCYKKLRLAERQLVSRLPILNKKR